MKRPKYRLAVLASHPIQYQAPLFRALSARPEIDLHVLFCSRRGLDHHRDPGFGVDFAWDVPLLEGYSYQFLRDLSPLPGSSRFLDLVNPGILPAILRGRFDAVWIHGWGLATNWIAWAGSTFGRLPLLLRGESNGLTEPTGLKGRVKRAVLKTLFSRVSAFLAIGTNNANFYGSYGVSPERIFKTPYAVDNDFFIERARALKDKKPALREKEGLPAQAPVILYSGKLQEKKGPLDLLQAFAHMKDRPASLAFLGDGPLRPAMERFIAEQGLSNVHILGFRNQTEVSSCYALADVLVLPSRFEPWGLVVNEAMCFGMPIVASDQVGAAADLVKPGTNGFTFPAGNVRALAERLSTVLEDEERRKKMGQASYEIVSRWGFEEDIQGVLEALERVTSRPDQKGND